MTARAPEATAFRSVGACFLALLTLCAAPINGSAQELTGVALGPDDEPIVGTPVILHRVGGGAGGFVSTDTTNAEGGFRFALEPADSAIYFAALRYDDAMYIGPAVQAGAEPVTGYILQVEPGAEAGAVASALSSPGPVPTAAQPASQTAPDGRSPSDAGALVLVGLLALAAVAAFLFAAPRYRRRQTRNVLLELATVENVLAEQDDPRERDRLQATRDRLRNQLAPRR